MIVVDTNVIAYLLIQGEKTDLARELREREPEWVAPDLWSHEFLNILVTHCLFAGIPLAAAQGIWVEALAVMRGNERNVTVPTALSLAVDHSVTGYDAEFIALARELGVKLVTEDKTLRKKFPDTALSMKGFLESLPGPSWVREARATYGTRRKAKRGR